MSLYPSPNPGPSHYVTLDQMRASLRAKSPEFASSATASVADVVVAAAAAPAPVAAGVGGPLLPPGAAPPPPADGFEHFTCVDGAALEVSYSADRRSATARRGGEPITLTRSDDGGVPTYSADGASLRRIGPRLAWRQAGGEDSVTVQAGDTLSKIALRQYGSLDQVAVIVAANADQISDPNLIFPGQVLKLPGGGAETSCLRTPASQRA